MVETGGVLVPVCFEVADQDTKTSGEAIEVGPDCHIQISASTIEALKIAAKLADNRKIRLVHATPDLTHLGVYGGPEAAWFPQDSAAAVHHLTKERSLAVLRAVAARYLGDCEVQYHVVPGSATRVILEAAEAVPPQAIVLAASGRGRVRRAMLGSTADKVIREANCPVTVVPARNDSARHTEASF